MIDLFPQLLKTSITFRQQIPANTPSCEVRASGVGVFQSVDGDSMWVVTPVEKVGLFKPQYVINNCRDLSITRVDIEIVSGSSDMRGGRGGTFNQFSGVDIPVEQFDDETGVVWDICFPEHITFTVTNKTNTPREFFVWVRGLSRPDWIKR